MHTLVFNYFWETIMGRSKRGKRLKANQRSEKVNEYVLGYCFLQVLSLFISLLCYFVIGIFWKIVREIEIGTENGNTIF